MEITPETIMPDGRPFFAWQNELSMCRNDYQKNKQDRAEIENLMTILRVVEIEEQKQPHDGDYLFRIRRSSILDANSAGQALAAAEVERISGEATQSPTPSKAKKRV